MTVTNKSETEKKTIEGNLEGTDLAGIFQYLQKNGSEGILEIRFEEVCVQLFFREQGVTLVEPSKRIGAPVLGRLIHRNRINREQHDHALREAAPSDASPIDLLEEMEIVDRDEIHSAVRECLEEDLLELFSLTQASFRFAEEPFDHDTHWDIGCIPAMFVDVDRIVLEAARRSDEWEVIRRQVPDLEEIYRPARGGNPEQEAPPHWEQCLLLGLIDGQRSLSDVLELTALTRFEVCRTVGQLLQGGWIERRSPSDLVKEGERRLKKNQAVLATRFLRLALRRGAEDPQVHLLLARAHERCQDFEEAGIHYCEAARLQVGDDCILEAFRNITKAVEMVPAASRVREERLRLYVKYRQHHPLPSRGIVPEAISVAQGWVDEGRVSEATDLLRRLDRLEHGNLELKTQIVELLLDQGMEGEAIVEYEKLGSYLVARGMYEDATRVFKKILSLDHTRLDIGDKLKRIDSLRKHRRSRRRRLVLLLAVFFVVAALGLVYTAYSQRARGELRRILSIRAREKAPAGDTIGSLEKVSEQFPLTPTARNAAAEIQRLEDEEARRTLQRRIAFDAQRKGAQSSLQQAEQSIDEGRLEEALVHIQTAIERAPDAVWVDANDLERQKERILRYLAEGEDLYRRSREALRAGGVEESFELTRILLAEYPKSPFARDARLPIRVESTPAGATVRMEGSDRELVTPCVLMVDPQRSCGVRIDRAGFETSMVSLEHPDRASLSVLLSKKPRWTFPTQGAVVGAPTARNGVVFLGSRDASVYALDPSGPTTLWKRDLGAIAEVEAPIGHDEVRVFVAANDRRVYALDQGDGTVHWSIPTAGFVESSFLVRGDRLYFGCSRGFLYAVDASSGALRWRTDLGPSVLPGILDLGPDLLAGTTDGILHRIDPGTGAVRSRIDVGGSVRSRLASAGNRILVGTEDGRICAIDSETGRLAWVVRTGRPVRSGFTVLNGTVYAGGDDGTLRGIRLEDGVVLASFRCPGRIRSTPLVFRGRLYFGAMDHRVYCLEAGGLDLAWRAVTGGAIEAAPFEAYGSIFVGSGDHSLYSFDP